MPNFNKEAARRGNEIVERGTGNGNFRPFLPSIYWKNADDEHCVLILNALEEITRLDFHPYIDTEDGPRSVIARTDPTIGERTDPISDTWNYKPRLTDLMIAVELEPEYEVKMVNGRERKSVNGFIVSTRTIERRLRDEDGELTEDKEEVEIPLVGYIAQSPYNFGNQLNSYEHSENPINLTPFRITKVGEGSGATFRFDGYPDAEFDLTNLLEYIENISYIQNPDEILELIDNVDQTEAASIIGEYLLDLKLEELADPEYYDEIFKAIDKPARFGKKDVKKEVNTRPKRTTQRRATSASTEDIGSTDSDNSSEPVEKVARSRKPSEKSSQLSAREKLEELKAAKAKKEAEKAEKAE